MTASDVPVLKTLLLRVGTTKFTSLRTPSPLLCIALRDRNHYFLHWLRQQRENNLNYNRR
jgi:hypothetical protein